MQEGAGADVDGDVIAVATDLQQIERPERRLRLAVDRPEAVEVVLADQHGCGIRHGGFIERHRDMPAHGATVVPVSSRGYGSALYAGCMAAKGEWIIMGDSDDSYDFSNLNSFVEKFKKEYPNGFKFSEVKKKLIESLEKNFAKATDEKKKDTKNAGTVKITKEKSDKKDVKKKVKPVVKKPTVKKTQ